MASPKKKIGRGVKDLIKESTIKSATQASFKRSGSTAKGGAKPASKAASKPAAKPAATTSGQGIPTLAPAKSAFLQNAISRLAFREIPISSVVPTPHQSRKKFDESSLTELSESIRAEGLLQPIVVREKAPGQFQLIAGERRLRACKQIGLRTIEARIVKASDASSAAMTLIENLQRENLDPIEEAFGIGSLMRDFNLTQEAVSDRLGKARSSIANSLRLLSLDREIQGYISTKKISVGHAKVLLGIEDAAERMLLARRLVETECSVREAEALAKKIREGKFRNPKQDTPPVIREVSQEIFKIEKDLCSRLHTKVQVKHGKNSGKIIIEYHGNDDLARLLECFGM
ncbi:MAG: ParB/RepB/Spo0J family partition protein [Opitutae bacterium]|nr:ParB/RepB/Spo0J family partition protein [Opitutae bacterium]